MQTHLDSDRFSFLGGCDVSEGGHVWLGWGALSDITKC